MIPPVVIERDISSTIAEFDASLRSAGVGVEGGAPRYRVTDGAAVLDIDVTIGPERRIALIRLPTLHLTYRFVAGAADAQHGLLARLDRAMHRGGG